MEAGISAKTVAVEVEQPYLAHACMEPMNFTVAIRKGSAEVWGPTQAQSLVQSTVADVAGLEPGDVTVHTTFLGGGFGRRSAQDFVRAAAEIAKAVEKPVKFVYSREDDMRAGRYRPFNLTRAFGSLDDAGKISAVGMKIAAPSISKWSGLNFLIRKDGVDEQAVEGLINLPYAIPNTQTEWVDHDPGIPVHFWRAVGASHNPFVVETLIDELAAKAGKDPLNFRRDHLRGKSRHLEVLARLEKEARWNEPLSPGVGRGLAIVESFESIVAEGVIPIWRRFCAANSILPIMLRARLARLFGCRWRILVASIGRHGSGRGTMVVHAPSKRPDLSSARKLRTPWPPSRPQRCPERFIRLVTKTLFAASTAPDPIAKPTLAACA